MAWVELSGYRTRSSKTFFDSETGKFHWEQIAKTALHYPTAGADSDVLDGVTNMTPVRVNNAAFDGWRVTANTWQYALGIDKLNHPGEDGWVGFGGRQGQHWFKFRLQRAGYLKWSTREFGAVGDAPTYDRARLTRTTQQLTVGPEGAEQTVNALTEARWADLWPALPQGQVDVLWRAEGRQFKEEIVINQAAREWIAANRPPSYYFPGIQLNDAYFGFVFRLDWSDIPKAYRGLVEVDPDGDFTDDGENIYLKDALDRLLAFMPIDLCYVPGAEENGSTPIRKRLYKDGDNYYLLMGVRCDLLASLPTGDLVFDPTFTDGYGGDVETYFDTCTQQSIPDTDQGTALSINVTGQTNKRLGLLKFDLSSLTDVIVDSATLYLYCAAQRAADGAMKIHRILSANSGWLETCTWNYADGAGASDRWAGDTGNDGGADAGCVVSGTDHASAIIGEFDYVADDPVNTEYVIGFDLTEFGSMIDENHGILVRTVNTGAVYAFRASDYSTTSVRPKLVVVYEAGGGTQYDQAVAGAITPSGTVTKRAGKIAAGELTSAGVLVKAARKVLAGAITPDGALSRLTSKILAGEITPSGVAGAIITELVSIGGELTPAGELVRQVGKSLAGAITPAGVVVKRVYVFMAGAITPAGTVIKRIGKVLHGRLTPLGEILSKLFHTQLPFTQIYTVPYDDRVIVVPRDHRVVTVAYDDRTVTP